MVRGVCQARPSRKACYSASVVCGLVSATIGVPRRRVDGEQKVRGATRYAADLPIAGVLHGRLVLATEAHARVKGIEAEAGRATPAMGGFPPPGALPVSPTAPGRAGEPLAREEVV